MNALSRHVRSFAVVVVDGEGSYHDNRWSSVVPAVPDPPCDADMRMK